MFKKQYFLIVDTETTQDGKVADFGAIVVDRSGKIYTSCAVMVDGIFTDKENHPLFFDSSAPASTLWSRSGADKRYSVYSEMVANGRRMVASVAAINRWLAKANATYAPYLTAYNLAFDRDKCNNTGIDLDMFEKSFCLWYAAFSIFAHTKAYRAACLELHAFNAPTAFQNMSFKTNAETMARFITGNLALEDEPHTALEDAKDYELPILVACLQKWGINKILTDSKPFNWREVQVKDWFKPA